MGDKIIKILVCTYQGEKYIAEQLDSIIAQTYKPIEIHIFDDCSSDDTLSILKKYCHNYSNFYCYENERNIGFLRSFENAIQVVNGEYMALSDQDDVWHPDKLQLSMREMMASEKNYPDAPILIHSDLSMIDYKGEELHPSFFKFKKISLPENKSLGHILGHCGIMGNTIIMNRKLAERALPFPPELIYHDYWLAIIAELFGTRITLGKSLVRYRIHESNTSSNNSILTVPSIEPSKWYERKYKLPFMGNNRVETLSYLLKNYDLNEHDTEIVKGFSDYLVHTKKRFSSYLFLLRNNFLKQNMNNKIIVLFKIIFIRYEN